MEHYDVAVIGGGPGGYVCAIRCAQLGLKTVLVEKEHLGGTCLNRGCIPTKSLLQSAKLYSSAMKSKEFGIICKDIEIDFAAIMKRKDHVVLKLRHGIESLVKGNGCSILTGVASFIDQNTLEVQEISQGGDKDPAKTQIHFDNAVIATGSAPSTIHIEGLDSINWVNSDGFLMLEKLPDSALIIGTGVIGMEFCTFLNSLGSKIIMADILPEIIGGIDEEIAKTLRKIMEKRGVAFRLDTKIVKFEPAKDKIVCHFEKHGKMSNETVDIVIMAAGRRANTNGLHFETIGIQYERGFICIDDFCTTNIPNIFAIGDVNGKVMLAHAASAQGMVVANNFTNEKKQKAEFSLVPSCIYTEPEIATVGLNETKAKLDGMDVAVGKFNVNANGKSLVIGENEGFVKIVADKKTGEVLGLQLLCAHATDMIGEGLLAIKLESTLEEIGEAIHPHPTLNEMIMEAAHAALGHCVHKVGNF